MIDKLLFEYKKKYKSKHTQKTKSHSLSKKNGKHETNLSEAKTKHKQTNKNIHQRNILFSNKQSIINLKSTSTSSLSSSAEKKYLTPTKYNLQNCDNDYYFNQSYNKAKELFINANIPRPKFDYSSKHKKNVNILTIGTRLNTIRNNTYINNNYEKSKVLMINRSFKGKKNKYVICRKNNLFNDGEVRKEKFNESKSVENYHNINVKNNENEKNICKYSNLKNCFNDYHYNVKFNYSAIKGKCFVNEENSENENNINDIKSYNKERKFKNIVLRPHKIQKQNELKHNIKVNNYEIDDSPKVINKIMTKLNIKPKHSRVFKCK